MYSQESEDSFGHAEEDRSQVINVDMTLFSSLTFKDVIAIRDKVCEVFSP